MPDHAELNRPLKTETLNTMFRYHPNITLHLRPLLRGLRHHVRPLCLQQGPPQHGPPQQGPPQQGGLWPSETRALHAHRRC